MGGKAWFGLETKSFEIFVEKFNGQVEGRVLERGRDFSCWIRRGSLLTVRSYGSLLQ